jgi:DNA-binding GntR family transcriptional regulator
LREILDDIYRSAAAGDRAAVANDHTKFHGLFYLNAGNKYLRLFWARLESPLRMYLLVHQTTFGQLTGVPEEHERIVELVASGDHDELANEIRHHFRVNLDALLKSLEPTPSAGEVIIHESANSNQARSPTVG